MIRGRTISYSAYLKRERHRKEIRLEENLNSLYKKKVYLQINFSKRKLKTIFPEEWDNGKEAK